MLEIADAKSSANLSPALFARLAQVAAAGDGRGRLDGRLRAGRRTAPGKKGGNRYATNEHRIYGRTADSGETHL
jgi:hypothetical protein